MVKSVAESKVEKSVAESREVISFEDEEAAELAASCALVVAFVIGTVGLLEANRTPAPFRIKRLIGEN